MPGGFRTGLRFVRVTAAPGALFAASPALAQGVNAASLSSPFPLAMLLGAGAVAMVVTVIIRSILREGKDRQRQASDQVAALRAMVDDYEALLSGTREATIIWTERSSGPKFLGQTAALLPAGRRPEAILDFASWLVDADAQKLITALEALRVRGHGLELTLRARDGRTIRANGWVLGGGAALRLHPAQADVAGLSNTNERLDAAQAVLAALDEPAFLTDERGAISFANPAYRTLAASLGKNDMLPDALARASGRSVVGIATAAGKGGYLRPAAVAPRPAEAPGQAHLNAIINALATPIAIFGAARELVHFNPAYAALWQLDPKWLKPGMDERAILDRLRTDGMLPAEPDYQAWRARHLQSYQMTRPRDEDWHLPNGRTIEVIAAPAGAQGGVIYVFEDITDQLKLKSEHRTLIDVQRSTLNALSEGVAVFGTNGRLTLSNPRLSTLWKLPTNLLETNPHIDQIIGAVAQTLPADGTTIWRDLKRGIIDLNPTRTDQQGRISRADGRLLDYAITRLPDGQTMMSFVDVTEIANYQRVLKERNEALITADRLKDAFVQNVSYELRSPLTNIIGFSDLLSSESVGPLTDKQRAYAGYIRASSVTLGVLIDNILDLATVDAGIAELRIEEQNVAALVEKARAGLAATFPDVDGQKPLNLVFEVPPDLGPLQVDGTRIVQVLYNLLSTAARFSEPGGLVKLRVADIGDRMVFTVEDEGAQMNEEMRAAMLQQVDSTISGRQRGAALGLAIVKTFVNLHGGIITVEKREPRGSRVIVTLPRLHRMAGATAAE
ncbi:MAG: PAS-domain containing protein [Devosia sp.]